MIDVGGPSMLRGGGEELRRTSPPSAGPSSTTPVLAELRATAALSLETRRALAARGVRARRAAYDAAIARWFAETQPFPDQLTLTFRKVTDLALRREPAPDGRLLRARSGAREHLLSQVEPARRQGALVQQPRRPRGRAPGHARVRRCRRR